MSRKFLTIISADNLDSIHSFSRVYCGNQESSWHGTTVQAVQSQPTVTIRKDAPTTETDCAEDMVISSSTHTCTSEGVLESECESQSSPLQTSEGVLESECESQPSPRHTGEGVLESECESQSSPLQTGEGVLNIETNPMEVVPQSPLTYTTESEFKTVGETTSNEVITAEHTRDRHPDVPPTGTSEMQLRSRLAKRPLSCLLSPSVVVKFHSLEKNRGE